jgi:hypothetical protein
MTQLVGPAAVFALAGCATPGYNPTRLESQLVHAGATRAEARCVTDGLSATFDENQLGSHSSPADKELATTRQILERCGVNLPLQPR